MQSFFIKALDLVEIVANDGFVIKITKGHVHANITKKI